MHRYHNNHLHPHHPFTEQQIFRNSQQSQSSPDERFSSPEHSFHEIQNEQQLQQQHFLPSVKKFLSQPNPLMNKIEFTPYQPKCYYPRALTKLPKGMRDYQCVMQDKNNMNALAEAKYGHDKMKRDVLGLLSKKGNSKNDTDKKHLITLDDYYGHKQPIYERYSKEDMKLQENKLNLRYFATYVLDMAKILRKQLKLHEKQHNPHSNTQTAQTTKSRPSSVARSSNIPSNFPPKSSNLLQRLSSRRPSSFSSNLSTIQFSSHFQSGNLYRAYQRQYLVYDLILQNDINTKGNTQWFFFSVKNAPKNATIKFNIVNMSKKDSLFDLGMRPCVYSMVRYEKRKVGWVREGQKVTYQESDQHRKESSKSPYYVLSFEYKFLYDGDVVYFAHSIPYTLTDFSCFLNTRLKDKTLHKLVKIKNVGLTLGSNQVDLLEITNSEVVNKAKKSVWIMARQHPGETTSGFMLQGIIDFLITPSQESTTLLNNFIFKIVPMVNVDGVIHGNSRAQFIGLDPNRRWSAPNKLHNPILYSIKHYIQKDPHQVQLILDLHSHSRKLGTFFYGNTLSSNTAATRIYPLLVCKSDERFQFKHCRFVGGSNNAARFALFQSLKIPLIYTVESSFYGYVKDEFRIVQYMPKDYKDMGESLMKGFLEYEVRKNLITHKFVAPVVVDRDLEGEVGDDEFDKDSVGSAYDPDEDEYNEKEFKKLITQKKDKKKKKKKNKQPLIKIKPPPVQQPIKMPSKPKANTSQSYYKEYFSGRLSVLQNRKEPSSSTTISLLTQKKETFNFGTQVNFKQQANGTLYPLLANKKQSTVFGLHNTNILTERGNCPQQLLYGKLNGLKPALPNNLCVIGQKVEEISVYGNTVGIQVTEHKEVFISRYDQEGKHSQTKQTRKSFSVRQRVNSFLQVKENNFLQRGDCMTKNFFSRR